MWIALKKSAHAPVSVVAADPIMLRAVERGVVDELRTSVRFVGGGAEVFR